MEPILLTFVLFATAILLLYKYLTWNFDYFEKLGVPGPKPKLIFGNFPSAITGQRHIFYEVDEIYTHYKRKHRAIGVFMTRNPVFLILDPQLAHEIMVTNFRKFRDNLSSKWIVNPKADEIAERNPFFTRGEAWKTKRTDVLGGLTLHKLNLAYPIWKDCARKLSDLLKEKTATGSAIIETKDLGKRFTSSVMGDFLWGINSKTLEQLDQPNEFLQMSMKMLVQCFTCVTLYYKLNFAPFLRRFCNYRFYPEETDQFFSQLTKQAYAIRQQDAKAADRADYLNYIMQLQEKKNLSHVDVMGNIMTAMLDGYETTATALFHTIFYLAKHSEIQEKLRSEILSNLEPDGFINFETLNILPFLDQCVHETIRIVTLLDAYARICTEPTELVLDDDKRVPISVGTVFLIPVFSYHHDPDYFPGPYNYNPERFDNGLHTELTKQGIFMPFGEGPRICIGMRMGLFSVKTALVEILKQYRVKCCAKTIEEKKPDAHSFIMGLEGDFWLEYERL